MSKSFGIESVSEYSYSTRRLTVTYTLSVILLALTGAAMVAANEMMRVFMRRVLLQPATVNAAYTMPSTVVALTRLALSPIDSNVPFLLAALTSLAALSALPAIAYSSRAFIKATSILTLLALLGEVVFGLSLWIITLLPGTTFFRSWTKAIVTAKNGVSRSEAGLSGGMIAAVQDALNCCGYGPPVAPTDGASIVRQFVTSAACPSVNVASSQPFCAQVFADQFSRPLLSKIYAALFSFAGIAALSILAGIALHKRVTELERFKRIDVKKNMA